MSLWPPVYYKKSNCFSSSPQVFILHWCRLQVKLQFVHYGMAFARVSLNKFLHGDPHLAARPLFPAAKIGPTIARIPAPSLSSAAAASDAAKTSDKREVTVKEGSRSPRRRSRSIWRDLRDLVPFRLVDGLGNALMQVSESLSKPLEKLSPRRLLGKMKEEEEQYKLRFEMPGLGKEDVKISVEDGVLVIRGERKEVEAHDEDDEWWSESLYGYYQTSLLLPDDARADEITAEMKHGVLYVIVPRVEEKKRDVTEVPIQ